MGLFWILRKNVVKIWIIRNFGQNWKSLRSFIFSLSSSSQPLPHGLPPLPFSFFFFPFLFSQFIFFLPSSLGSLHPAASCRPSAAWRAQKGPNWWAQLRRYWKSSFEEELWRMRGLFLHGERTRCQRTFFTVDLSINSFNSSSSSKWCS